MLINIRFCGETYPWLETKESDPCRLKGVITLPTDLVCNCINAISSYSFLFGTCRTASKLKNVFFGLQDGTFEQIILDIKAEPYRTNDAMRRSVRR
jgi:hypothetical protein